MCISPRMLTSESLSLNPKLKNSKRKPKMNTKCSPEELCAYILERSSCAVKVGAVIADSHGIFGWGWNHMGSDGFGEHAEVNAIKRSNRDRLPGSTLFVASVRGRSEKPITSKPCDFC